MRQISLEEKDPVIAKIIQDEKARQNTKLQMIPSENFMSPATMQALGTVLNNKYAEGYPKKRYYQGNENVDCVEQLAIERAKKLFQVEHANVQPLSGSPANFAVYHALLKPQEKIMGLRLDMGGHLTHGHKVSATSRYFTAVQYPVDKETHEFDMDTIRKVALQEQPKILVSGTTAYPRKIDFKAFHDIACEVGAYSHADVSHIAGLIAGGAHQSPFPFVDTGMSTTHKTLRGPRSALIVSKKEDRLADITHLDEKKAQVAKDLARKIDRAVFPGLQGGPHEDVIAAKAVCFQEAMQPSFKRYAHLIVKNAQALAQSLMDNGIKLVTNGTDNHLILIDLTPFGIGLGNKIAVALEEAGFVTNANTVPYDQSTPFKPSGIRIGTPAMTTQGLTPSHMIDIGKWMSDVIKHPDDKRLKQRIAEHVRELCWANRPY